MEGRRVNHNLGGYPDEEKRLRVLELYVEKGLDCAAIGREVGVTRQAVRQLLVRCGVSIRPRWP